MAQKILKEITKRGVNKSDRQRRSLTEAFAFLILFLFTRGFLGSANIPFDALFCITRRRKETREIVMFNYLNPLYIPFLRRFMSVAKTAYYSVRRNTTRNLHFSSDLYLNNRQKSI